MRNCFIKLQLFAEPDNAQGEDTPPINYEEEYKKVLAERDSFKQEAEKQKGLKDKYASENAEYKKKEIDKMSDDEKKAKEYQELIDSKTQMEAKIKAMELEKELLANGFTSEESEKLLKGNFAVKDIAEILKTKIEDAVKSAKAEMLKNGTPDDLLNNGDNKGKKSSYQLYEESKQTNNNKVEF